MPNLNPKSLAVLLKTSVNQCTGAGRVEPERISAAVRVRKPKQVADHVRMAHGAPGHQSHPVCGLKQTAIVVHVGCPVLVHLFTSVNPVFQPVPIRTELKNTSTRAG